MSESCCSKPGESLQSAAILRAPIVRSWFHPVVIAAVAVISGSLALGGTYSPTPTEPVLNPVKINFGGSDEDVSSTIAVEDGAEIAISASATDEDTLVSDGTSAASSLEDDPGAQIVWSGSGSFSYSRSNSGQTITWTAPTLGPSETSRTVSITAQPDDDSTSDPGGPLNGHSGNRNDGPGTGVTLTVLVTKECTITKVTTAKDYVKIGVDVGFTAEGANLGTASWSGGGTPATGTGASFTTKWNSSGEQTVTASCGTTSKSKAVKVVEVTALARDGGDTDSWDGNNNSVCAVKDPEGGVVLRATTNPDEPGAWDLIDWTGGTAGAAPNLRTVLKSSSGKTDVTATCGTSSKTKTVVVVWVTFTNFQTAAPKPADSDVQPPVWGVPADKARNGVLIQATVEPVDAGDYGVTFDIKRTRETVVWVKSGGTWTQAETANAGTNDDNTNTDEDLTPSAAGHIYASDAPGTPLAAPPAGVQSFVLVDSFIEWVNVTNGGAKKASDDYPWHCSIWVDNNAGAWKRNNTIITNEITTGSITVNHTDEPPDW